MEESHESSRKIILIVIVFQVDVFPKPTDMLLPFFVVHFHGQTLFSWKSTYKSGKMNHKKNTKKAQPFASSSDLKT